MKITEQVQLLESLAVELGLKVAYEPMGGVASARAGLCRVRGEYRLIMDRRLKPSERAQYLAEAIARFDLRDLEIPNGIAALIARYQEPPRRSA